MFNREIGIKARIVCIKGLWYAECSDGDYTHGHKSKKELVQLMESWGFELL